MKENESKVIKELPDNSKNIKRKRCFLNKVMETIGMSFERISKRLKLVLVIAYITRSISD